MGGRPVRGDRRRHVRARHSVLRLARDVDDADPAVGSGGRGVRAGCSRARDRRPQPARDDKVVAAWNGLAVTALAEHAVALHRRRRVERARDAARARARRAARRPRTGGRAAAPGVPRRRGRRAGRGAGGLRLRGGGVLRGAPGDRRGALAGRWPASCSTRRWPSSPPAPAASTTPPTTPSGWSPGRPTRPTTPRRPGCRRSAAALVAYAALTGEPRYREAAEAALATVAPIVGRHPRFTGYAAAVGEALLSGPYEIAVATPRPGRRPAGRGRVPARPARCGRGRRRAGPPGVPLLADRPMRGRRARPRTSAGVSSVTAR